MKLRFAILTMLMLSSAILTSCWKTDEDWSLCAEDNLVLEFGIENVPDAEFSQYIGAFDVYLFDAEHHFVDQRTIDSADTDGTYRTKYTLSPGIYYAVCWANTGSNSRMTISRDGTINLENSFVEIGSSETGDPIYYAPNKTPGMRGDTYHGGDTRAEADYKIYEIAVPENESLTRRMLFGKVHRTVEVFISRYENTELYDGRTPVVERSGARTSYDFLLRADISPRTLRREATPSDREEATLSTLFHSALVPIQGDGWVSVIHPATGNVLGTIKIADYIERYNIVDDSYIPIQFVFDMDANVSVTMPTWNENEIDPGELL